jgi:hypothetical protein
MITSLIHVTVSTLNIHMYCLEKATTLDNKKNTTLIESRPYCALVYIFEVNLSELGELHSFAAHLALIIATFGFDGYDTNHPVVDSVRLHTT